MSSFFITTVDGPDLYTVAFLVCLTYLRFFVTSLPLSFLYVTLNSLARSDFLILSTLPFFCLRSRYLSVSFMISPDGAEYPPLPSGMFVRRETRPGWYLLNVFVS